MEVFHSKCKAVTADHYFVAHHQAQASIVSVLIDAGASTSSDPKLDKLLEDNSRILGLLEAKPVIEYRFSEAKTGKSTAVGSAMQQLGLVLTTPGVLPNRWPTGYRNYTFEPFRWPLEADEDKETPKLQAHFQQQLEQLGVAFGKGAFELLDVRHQDRLGFHCDTGAGTLVFRGGTDAVIVPYGELSWELQLRVVVDWKTPKAFNNLRGMDLQQKLELLGSLYHSNHPSLVVFTDLTNFAIYQPHSNAIQYLHTFTAPASGRIATSDAMRFIARQLMMISSKDPRFQYQRLDSIQEHAELRHEAKGLLNAKRLAGFDEGLTEQLSIVKDLPAKDQFEAACSLVEAWRPQLSYFS